jgi:hypothetical protein
VAWIELLGWMMAKRRLTEAGFQRFTRTAPFALLGSRICLRMAETLRSPSGLSAARIAERLKLYARQGQTVLLENMERIQN